MRHQGLLNYVVMDRWFDKYNYDTYDYRWVEPETRRWNGATNGRIKCSIGPHAPHSCSEEPMSNISRIALMMNVPIHLHLAESAEESGWIEQKFNLYPVELVDKAGILTSKTVAVHCVNVDKKNIKIISEKGAKALVMKYKEEKSGQKYVLMG